MTGSSLAPPPGPCSLPGACPTPGSGMLVLMLASEMNGDQLQHPKELEKENERLRRAVSDLTLDELILKEAARGNL